MSGSLAIDELQRGVDGPSAAPQGRSLPQALEAEQALLGAVLVNNDAWRIVSGLVEKDDFSEPLHAVMWEVVDGLCRQGIAATPVTVIPYLGSADLGSMTAPHYLARLAAEATTIVNAPDYARIIRNLAARRRMIAVANTLIVDAFNAGVNETPQTIIDRAQEALEETRPNALKEGRSRVPAAQIVADMIDKADRIARGEDVQGGSTTGLLALDEAIGGFNAGELVIVAGRPGMGKSTLATSLALACSAPYLRRQARALFVSLELSKDAIASRLAADAAYSTGAIIAHSDIRAGRLSAAHIAALRNAEDAVAAHRLTVEYSKGRSLHEIDMIVQAENKRLARSGEKLDVVFVDQLKQIKAPERYKGNRNNEIGEIVWGLRELAQRHGFCCMLMCQLNRSVESRDVKNKRPSLSDLRDSGELEQDADVVLFVYREAYYLKKLLDDEREPEKISDLRHRYDSLKHEMEIIVAKNRHGDQQTVKAWCDIAASAVRPARSDLMGRW